MTRLFAALVVGLLVAGPCLPVSVFGQSPAPDAAPVARDLQREFENILRQARAIVVDMQGGATPAGKLTALLALFDQVRAEDLLITEHQVRVASRLQEEGASGTIHRRQADASTAYRDEMDRLVQEMDAIVGLGTGGDPSDLRRALEALIHHLEQQATPQDRTPLGGSLPYRALDLPQTAPQLGAAIVPAYASRALLAPAASDLDEGPEVPLTAEILAQVRALHQNPIEIFELVQNQVEMEFYHGAMKGALETLREKRGNDVDQASLLIALMRASGIPARYVRGVIALSGPQALSWTALSSTRRAAELLTRAGIPFKPVQQGGTIGSFQLEHTWVEIYVPYSNYRGAPLDNAGKAWIPLDPSMKSYQYNAGVDLLAAMNFKADFLVPEYLSGPQTLSPVDVYKKHITDYLTQYRPDLSYDQAVGTRSLQTVSVRLLPSTLPYPTVSVNQEGAALPEGLRHQVRFIAEGENGTSLDVTLPASELLGQRLTLSYVPATVEDQVAVDAFISLDNTPAYLIKLRPVLKVGGVIRGAGEIPIQMGMTHHLTIEIQTPRGTVSLSNSILAGGYYAIGLGLQKATYTPPDVPAPKDTEPGAADLLYRQAVDYLEGWNQAEQAIADILRVVNVRPALSEVMIGSVYNRIVLFGQPQEIDWRGVFVDADLRISEPVPVGADDGAKKEFMRLSGLAGSMLESGILEQNLEADAVSAAKLIQLAHDAGIPVDEIDAANIGVALPLLQTADAVKTEIADAVNQGWHAIIPRTDLTRNIWTGTGYILVDPSTGNGGYFISGSLAGGSTTQSPDDWVKQELKDRFKFANTPPPNKDPTAAAFIEKVPSGDKQNGKVGKKLDKPLVVWVRDRANKPVKGADVTFTILAGGGGFDAAGTKSTTVKTDDLGLARTTPFLGKKTSDDPFYVKAKTTDTYPTQVGQNIVTAKVSGTRGEISIDIPFQLFAYPEDPDHLSKVLGDNNRTIVGTSAGTIRVRVEDKYDNTLSNEKVVFTVLPAVPNTGSLPSNAKNIVIYPQEPPCPIFTPILGECNGVNQLTLATSIFGASVETILGNTVDTLYRVSVAVKENSAVPSQLFTLSSEGVRNFGTGEYSPPTLTMSALHFVNDKGELLNGTKVGTLFPHPLEIVLYMIEDDYLLVPTGTPCGQAPPDPPCYKVQSQETTRIRPVDIQKSGSISFAAQQPDAVTVAKSDETAVVNFRVIQGGGTTNPTVLDQPNQNPGQGRYASNLTVGPNPALNRVEIDATADVWIPSFDLHQGTVTPVITMLQPGQSVFAGLATGFPFTLTQEVFGVRATMVEKRFPVRGLESGSGVTYADFDLNYTIEPAGYRAETVYVDLFEDTGQWIGYVIGNQTSGAGTAKLFQGTEFNYLSKEYRMQAVLNRGSEAEVRSDKMLLKFIHFHVLEPLQDQQPLQNQKILIKNDNGGNPVMPELRAIAAVEGKGINPFLVNTLQICWKARVEYLVHPTKNPERSRDDGFLIPAQDCIHPSVPPLFVINWSVEGGVGSNFGGGFLDITATTNIDGIDVSDIYRGKIEGETFSDTFKNAITPYLENPDGDQTSPTIRSQVGQNKFFRVIATAVPTLFEQSQLVG
ncbi:MAG: hypothetical protein HY207_06080 [Nitrospirae bacterium]|nr:hypothetical protein [Nitrospirota bacterium]